MFSVRAMYTIRMCCVLIKYERNGKSVSANNNYISSRINIDQPVFSFNMALNELLLQAIFETGCFIFQYVPQAHVAFINTTIIIIIKFIDLQACTVPIRVSYNIVVHLLFTIILRLGMGLGSPIHDASTLFTRMELLESSSCGRRTAENP